MSSYRDIIEKLVLKVLPGGKKITQRRKADEAGAEYYGKAASSFKSLRGLKGKMLSPGVKKSPSAHNEVVAKFNADPEVRKLQDIINSYKLRMKYHK